MSEHDQGELSGNTGQLPQGFSEWWDATHELYQNPVNAWHAGQRSMQQRAVEVCRVRSAAWDEGEDYVLLSFAKAKEARACVSAIEQLEAK